MQSVGSILVMIWAPVLTLLVYPSLEKTGIKPTALRRMAVGMFLAAAPSSVPDCCRAQLDHGAKLSIAWQLVPYAVLEAGEVMLSATGLEFAFSQAPAMRSTITSFWLMTIAGGHFLVAAFTSLNDNYIHAAGRRPILFFRGLDVRGRDGLTGCAAAYRPPPSES